MAERMQNLKKVRGRVMKVPKTGLKPAILYGARCIGLPRKQVAMFRRASSACLPGSHKGCSTTLRVALQQSEQCHDLTLPPILECACAVWDSTVDSNILMAAWKRQLPRVALTASLPHVKGPAAAVADAVQRVGWTWPHYACFMSRDGLKLELGKVCPRGVEAMYKYDSDLALWSSWCKDEQYQSVRPRPLIEPIAAFATSNAYHDGGRNMALSWLHVGP